MRTFLISCVAALIIAVGGYFTLDAIQKPADIAFVGSGAQL